MLLDSPENQKKLSISGRAQMAMLAARDVSQAAQFASVDAADPRHGNTGGSSGQSEACNAEICDPEEDRGEALPQTTPPSGRKSRAKGTTPEMSEFLKKCVFYDWLSVTIPNGKDGKGSKRPDNEAENEVREAGDRLFKWATLAGMHVTRIGKGTDGYFGGAHLALDPTATDRLMTIRDGHSSNMPSIEITGGDGLCAKLAPRALDELGPVLVSRVDAAIDASREGL